MGVFYYSVNGETRARAFTDPPFAFKTNAPSRGFGTCGLDSSGRAPRNRRSRTSSGPEGSSDKWFRLCRGLFPNRDGSGHTSQSPGSGVPRLCSSVAPQ